MPSPSEDWDLGNQPTNAGANKRRRDDAQSDSVAKRRASRACLSCRGRKVRCDVTSRGAPCTNCRLDDVNCRLTESNRGRVRTSVEAGEDVQHRPQSQQPMSPGDMPEEPQAQTLSPPVPDDFPVSLTFEGIFSDLAL
ncbi:hypothetical protein Neosp_009224 [[Neocosmospora] mangrovei]